MSEKLRAFLGTAVMLAREVPGAIDVLDSKARQLIKLRDDFRGTHWGSEEDMHATTRVRVPDVSKGIVAMGPLVSLVYLATKGGGRLTAAIPLFIAGCRLEPVHETRYLDCCRSFGRSRGSCGERSGQRGRSLSLA